MVGPNTQSERADACRHGIAGEGADLTVGGNAPVLPKEFEQNNCAIWVRVEVRLLIVVDKLLTGFDAPSATYLYIDKTKN